MADKKSLRSFAELRSALKRTESDSEANALVKSSTGTRDRPTKSKSELTRIASSRPRYMSPADRFIAAALEIDLSKLSGDALHDAYVALGKAVLYAQQAIDSIRAQLDEKDPKHDSEWHNRATGALRHKGFEIQHLRNAMALCESMLN